MSNLVVVDENDILVGLSTIAQILQVSSKKTISNYVDRGMPYVPKGKQKEYLVKECIFWTIQNGFLKVPIDINADADEDEIEDMPPSMQKDIWDARTKKFKLEELQGVYVKKEEVKRDATNVSTSIKDKLFSLPSRLASELADEESPKEVIKILNREFRNLVSDVRSVFMD